MSIDTSSPAAAGSASNVHQQLLSEFATAYLAEQRRQRRWRWIWRIVWLGLLGLLVWSAVQNMPSATAPVTPHTALIEIRGEIGSEAEANADSLNSALKSAFEDTGAKAVVIRLNSPGGSPVQAGLVNEEILRLKALHKKPVYAVCEEMCASAAYYIAVAADRIYVNKASLVGSIGVLIDSFGVTGAMERFGVERRLLTAGENKAMLDPFSPLNPEHRAFAQAMIDQIHQQFIKVVKAGRGSRLKETPEIFSGLFWNGEQAVQLGLVDHLGSLDFVAREVVKTEEIIDYTVKENIAERLAKRFGAAVGEGGARVLRSAPAIR